MSTNPKVILAVHILIGIQNYPRNTPKNISSNEARTIDRIQHRDFSPIIDHLSKNETPTVSQ
jgi:hypothetical protein